MHANRQRSLATPATDVGPSIVAPALLSLVTAAALLLATPGSIRSAMAEGFNAAAPAASTCRRAVTAGICPVAEPAHCLRSRSMCPVGHTPETRDMAALLIHGTVTGAGPVDPPPALIQTAHREP